MGKKLVIVESPAKIKTLRKFLGTNYLFTSSVGHIRDLPAKEFGIDLENDFEPTYQPIAEKKDVIKELVQMSKKCDEVYLCPDPDREGEAIAWHISMLLPKGTKIKRATFNSITKEAVQKAVQSPREIDFNLVDAQQARRMLDRIVGYKISPLLNRRLQRGRAQSVSAGRVQSVALKLVVDREKEIEAFIPVEYWNLKGFFARTEEENPFESYLLSIDGKKVEKEAIEGKDVALIPNEETAHQVLARIKSGMFHVEKLERKEKQRHPVPPFITSTLQQEASRHHRFSSSRTMAIAQGLYEGIDMGEGAHEGLITYMRTDSIRIAPEMLGVAREFIKKEHGEKYLPEKPRQFSSKKNAQDAHEAIRPTNLAYTPEKVRQYLTDDQYKLYVLIWKRFMASQMASAIYDTASVDISDGEGVLFRTTGSILKFNGFLALYEEHTDDLQKEDDKKKPLPELKEGQKLILKDSTADQAFTRPPPRFTEASLVKELEKSGIGRPSTYTTIMNKIQSRDYSVKEANRLKPTELGRLIAEMLENSFQMIMNIDFTSSMEDGLEHIAGGEKEWKALLREFWKQFHPLLDAAEETLFPPKIETDILCPKCKKHNLQKIWSKNNYFYGCAGYPDCDYRTSIAALEFDKSDYAENFDWEQKCPKCSSKMTIRHGRYGTFLGCESYPDCKGIINIPKKGEEVLNQKDMPPCPAIGCDGNLQARRSRFGKIFYSCSNYPDCDVIGNSFDQIKGKYPNHPKTAYVKKTKKKGTKKAATKKTSAKTKKKPAKPRNMPPCKLSDELAKIVGTDQLPRTQVTKKIWEYIKANNLQDPNNKRIIKPDAALGKIFGSLEPVDMFKMAGLLSPHITKI